MKRILLITFMLVSALITTSWAQTRSVTGKVTSAEDGSTLPGVNVILQGTTTGTVTDIDGNYTVNVPEEGATLSFSFIGFTTQEVATGARSVVDVQMESDVQQLSELVVVGYGTQNRRDITGSIATVEGDVIGNQPVQSFDQALSGRLAGVQITNTSGMLADGVTVRIRGVNSISNSSQPLFVVDGVPLNTLTNLNVFNDGDGNRYNPMADINPNDIESMEVLKDASASAIYGSRAANGVVLITTKRGVAGTNKINYDFSTGWNEASAKPKMLNGDDFIAIQNEKARNAGLTSDIAANIDVDGDGKPDRTNWIDELFGKGFYQTHQLSLSGGNDKVQYYGAGSYTDQNGYVYKNRFRRGAITMNLDLTPKDWIKSGISATVSKSLSEGVLSERYLAGVGVSGYQAPPNVPFYDADGNYYLTAAGNLGNGNNNSTYFPFAFYHVPGTLELNRNHNQAQRIIANGYVTLLPIDGLSITTRYGIDYISNFEDQYSDPTFGGLGRALGAGLVQDNYLRRNLWNWSNFATYDHTFGFNHNVSITAGIEYQNVLETQLYTGAGDFADPYFTQIIDGVFASDGLAGGLAFGNGFDSYFGRFNYSFSDKYYAQFALRADAYSGFGANNKRGTFPAGSIGWRISQESFMDGVTLINDLKLRASYGVVGNSNIGSYASRTLYGGGQYASLNGLSPSQVGDDNLQWESSEKLDIGFDAAILRNKIGITFDYYLNNVSNLVLDAPVLRTSGIPNSTITTNIGSMKNQGIEVVINSTNIQTQDFSWNTSFNFTSVKNEVTELATPADIVSGNNRASVGRPLGVFKLIRWAGVNPDNGNAQFLDIDGNIKQYDAVNSKWLNANGGEVDPITADDAVYQGTPYPKFYGGLNNVLRYKGIEFTLFLQYSGGNEIYNGTRAGLLSTKLSNNLEDIKNRWQQPGDQTDIQKLVLDDNQSTRASTRWLEKGDFIRVKQIGIAYDFPKNMISTLDLASLRIFANVQNAFVFTKYKGLDPEANFNREANIAYGVDNNSVPQTRSFNFGLSVGF